MLFPSKYSAFLPALVLTLTLTWVSVQPGAARKKNKAQSEQLSYQPAGSRSGNYSAASDPNRQTIAGVSAAGRLTPAQQIARDLLVEKNNLQRQIDLLGAELPTARKGRARKITKELNVLANQMASVNRKLNNLPQSAFQASEENQPLSGLHHLETVEEMIQQKMAQKQNDPEWNAEPAGQYPTWPSDPQPAVQPARPVVAYRVQVAVTNRPTTTASSDLGAEVREVRRPDGKYAYYYGAYTSLSEAQEACRQVRTRAAYRDAFVIATNGDQRIRLDEAEQLLR